MKLRDSRRLTGPNLLLPGCGAIVDVELDGEPARLLVDTWKSQARRILEAVGWSDSQLAWRTYSDGASLAFSAPLDALYAATEVNEWALEAAQAALDGRPEPRLDSAAPRLLLEVKGETNPALLELAAATSEHGVALLADDELASVGLGTGSRTWPVDALPAPDQVPWEEIYDIPVVLVTGTNGKTTTVRLLASILAAAGKCVGYTSTDGIVVAAEAVESGDWSGPGGARKLLRDRRVEVGILECARGGMLRRGLGVEWADVGVITNVGADHLGEWGIEDLDDLTDAKFIVARAARQLVLNADDEWVVERACSCEQQILWYSTQRAGRSEFPQPDNCCVWCGSGQIESHIGCVVDELMPVHEIPITHGGTAGHNVSNALAAAAAASALSTNREAIRAGLSGMEQNPGRLERFEVDGVRVIVDFAHNPHGMGALLEMARSLRPQRLLVTLGQAGDRTDAEIEALARVVAEAAPQRVIVKELRKYLRGREEGAIPDLLSAGLRQAGYPEGQIERADSEMDSVRRALAWAASDDLLLLITLADRSAVLNYLRRLAESGAGTEG